jgi:hypothetical protein
MSVPE